jgi:hypothetical protein
MQMIRKNGNFILAGSGTSMFASISQKRLFHFRFRFHQKIPVSNSVLQSSVSNIFHWKYY